MITKCLLFTNGLVMTFDQDGNQMPEYQGEYGLIVDKLILVGVKEIELAQWMRGQDPNPWIILARFKPVLPR